MRFSVAVLFLLVVVVAVTAGPVEQGKSVQNKILYVCIMVYFIKDCIHVHVSFLKQFLFEACTLCIYESFAHTYSVNVDKS